MSPALEAVASNGNDSWTQRRADPTTESDGRRGAALPPHVRAAQGRRTRPLGHRAAALAAWPRSLASLLAPGTGSPLLSQAQRSLRDGDWDVRASRARDPFRDPRRHDFPLDPRTLDALAARITQRFPDAAADASGRAERVLAGRYDLLGYRDLPFGTPPAWHKDPVHDREAPSGFWSAIPYLAPQSATTR